MDVSKQLNNRSHVFIIAEAGSNWKCEIFDEDLAQAKKLVEIASNSGVDAVKFQTYSADKAYSQNAEKSDYLKQQGIEQSINEIFENFGINKLLENKYSFHIMNDIKNLILSNYWQDTQKLCHDC